MNILNLIPAIGTLILASILGLLLTWLARTQPTEPMTTAQSLPDPELTEREERLASPVLPAPRPDIFYAAILDRPLFAPKRRPVTSAPEIEPEPDIIEVVTETTTILSAPDDVTLSGILGGSDNLSALLGHGDTAAEWVREEDEIAGWIVSEIGVSWVVLSSGDQTYRLELFE